MTDERSRSTTGLADPTDARSNCGVGVVVALETGPSHGIVRDGLDLLANLEHRGTTGAESNTGDGAGILVQTPHDFIERVVPLDLPDRYAVGAFFLPTDDEARANLRALVEQTLSAHDLAVLHWREVPTNNADLGETAVASEPAVEQPIVVPAGDQDEDGFERDLYVGRRAVEKAMVESGLPGSEECYVCSLDAKTLVYKGLLTGSQLPDYYPDLRDERLASAFVMVHARFSTNTLGAWHLAHPYRTMIHNGEFNTIRGNVNWMRARENDLESDRFSQEELDTIRPIVGNADQSDTASVDNALELLLRDGRELPHALRMVIPEAWRKDEEMAQDVRDWYDYHASLVEPWDGPALVCATDGDRVGAVLDRNGLRPCRYDVTADGRLVMASEAGALDVPPSDIVRRDRLQPGQLLVADPEAGRIVPEEDLFDGLTDEKYGEWLDCEQVRLAELVDSKFVVSDPVATLTAHQVAFGYTRDELDELITPMATDGADPVGSMGDDTPLSVLSEYDRPLFSYFKQLFAQVSNPPIDYIREELVTSLESRVGPQRNLLGESAAHARQLVLDSPILTDEELAAATNLDGDLAAATIDLTAKFGSDEQPGKTLENAVERIREASRNAVEAGHGLVVLSDRRVGPDRIAVPSLLATAAVHHDLVRRGLRNRVGLLVESGEPRTVHHMAALIGYGAGAVNPYLTHQSVVDLAENAEMSPDTAIEQYVGALENGLLKTMAKMGISTVESYQGAQIFEAVGLDSDLVAEYFEGTVSRTEGIGLAEIESDLRSRHRAGFTDGDAADPARIGEFGHRRNGSIHHQWNPETVGSLQVAVRQADREEYDRFAAMINDQNETLHTLRGLLAFSSDRVPVPIDEVEPVESIAERFSTAPMSLGSLSPEMHETNAIATNRLGGKANTGEGGEPPERFGTDRECAVKQVASGRFGVTGSYLASADEVQIKMAQGSKPGEGGHLPGKKVNEMIADVRCATPGVGLISPPPQHDIYSIEDLKQLIYDLKAATDNADVSVKLVAEAGVGVIAAGCAKANADAIHISGHSGGTGASPKTSIKHVGAPWEFGLAEANQMLRETGLRSRVRLSVDGGLRTGRDVAIAALLGAEEYAFGTASLVTAGCVMARVCHTNNCPVGVATQREKLRERFAGEPEHVVTYLTFVAQELRECMAALGFRTVDEMVGRVECLSQREVAHPKARTVDPSAVLAAAANDGRTKTQDQKDELNDHVDRTLIEHARPAIERGEAVRLAGTVDNGDRAVGTLLSNHVVTDSPHHLPEDAITVDLTGTAGQSFGAFLADGISLQLTGVANDYVGKGLSGGRITVSRPADAGYAGDDVTIGNVALYGATAGELYVDGRAGERFAVRNSGVRAVVEGVGDHGCEYMTGGAVVVLGSVGRNFAAGMSGGVAYVRKSALDGRLNAEMVDRESALTDRDCRLLRRLVENHAAYTGSETANALLESWGTVEAQFVKIIPDPYRRAVEEDGRADVRDDLPTAARTFEPGTDLARSVGD